MFENVNRRCRHSHAEGLLPGVYAGQCSKILNYYVHETGGTQEKVLHPEGKGHYRIVVPPILELVLIPNSIGRTLTLASVFPMFLLIILNNNRWLN